MGERKGWRVGSVRVEEWEEWEGEEDVIVLVVLMGLTLRYLALIGLTVSCCTST